MVAMFYLLEGVVVPQQTMSKLFYLTAWPEPNKYLFPAGHVLVDSNQPTTFSNKISTPGAYSRVAKAGKEALPLS